MKTLAIMFIAALLLAACQANPQPAAKAEKPKTEKVTTPTPAPATAVATPAKVADDQVKVTTTTVQFPKGETGTEYKNSIAPGETQIYVVNVRKGQYLGAQTYSEDDNLDIAFTVRRKGGEELEVPAGSVKWGGEVPASGDYEIVVNGIKKATKYTISINAE